ncbi:fdxN element excision controlling factor protein [Leptolyngbya sp. NIES-3755]|nr:fdxN element excision controlling factor protein [Leptolyngbya sp. NIES-3755]
MADIAKYRQIVQEILTEHSQYKALNEEVEAQLIFDKERNRYQLVHAGWSNKRRVYGCVVQVDIKNDKIWIQHDGTEGGVALELEERGIPKRDIVLAFQSPFKRQFTEYAVG